MPFSNPYIYTFVHNPLADFYKSMMDYFCALYPRFQWKVMGTYQKAVEFLAKRQQYGRETDQPILPAILMNPSGDFGIDDIAGKFLWRFPDLGMGFATSRIFNPIYQDENIKIALCWSRLKGEIPISFLPSSYYEYMDMKMFFLLKFGGLERYIYPEGFHSFVILPREIYNYEYANPITGEHYTIDISHTYTKLISTIDREELVYPVPLNPRIRFMSMNDGSLRFGGIDKLSEWRLDSVLEYEINIPTFMIIETDYLPKFLEARIGFGAVYSQNPQYMSGEVPAEMFRWQDAMDTTEGYFRDELIVQGQRVTSEEVHEYENMRYFHIVTEEEAHTADNILITLPETIHDERLLFLFSKTGEYSYGQQYEIVYGGTAILLYRREIMIDPGDVLELYIYRFA